MGQFSYFAGKLFLLALATTLVLGEAMEVKADHASGLSITLRWNPNLERDIAGYRLYYGDREHPFSEVINVGNIVTATVSNLVGGNTYYFAVTAYNTGGFEGSFSNVVSYTVPNATPPPTTPTPTPSGQITTVPSSLTFTGIAGGVFPAPQSIQITTSTGVPWSESHDSPWFNVAPPGGASGTSTTVSPHTEGLVPGTYVQNIIFSALNLPNRIVGVTLILTPPPSPTSFVSDNFNRADGELGPNWTVDPTWGGGLSISGNKVVTPTSGAHYWTANSFGPDQYSQIKLTGPIGTWSGLMVRGNPRPAPFYLVRVTAGGTDLYSSFNGVFSQLAHNPTVFATGDVVKFAVRTATRNTAHLTVYRNGIEVFSYDDAISFIPGGQPGISLRDGLTGMSLDDWEGGELTGGSF